MNVLIYGYGLGEGGYACANYYQKKGHNVRITDLRDEASLGDKVQILKKKGIDLVLGKHRVEDFKWADLVIKTPAISPDSPFLEYAKTVLNDYSILFENENVAKVKLICVTGTTGKTITSEAVCQALKALNKKVRTCGTSDSPVFAELERWEDHDIPEYLVCKMSSWQIRDTFLYTEGCIPAVELAVITSLNLNEKYEMFSKQTKYLLCSQVNKQHVKDNLNINFRKVSVIENNIKGLAKDLPKNLQASYAILKRLGFKQQEINNALKKFKGIPHRMEIVCSKDDLLVVNDSSATIPEAVNFTIQNFISQPVHLICGGSNKNLSADQLIPVCKTVSSVYLLDGSFTQKKLMPLLKKNKIKFYGPYQEMENLVSDAKKNIIGSKKMLQVLLLSPGAPASEFFNDEFDRGNKFKACFK